MKSDKFLRERQPEWDKLAAYQARLAQGGMSSLTRPELLEFVRLYRRATSDLARARTLKVRSEVVDYLNQLVGRIHFQIYTTPSFRLRGLLEYFTHGFPAAIRRNWGWVVTAALLMLVPGILAYVGVRTNPALAYIFVPAQFTEQVGQYGETGRSIGEASFMTSFYINNNIRVSFMAFALGFFFGVGSIYILVENGAILGAMTALIQQHDHSFPFWSFVSAHFGFEMTAIVLAAAAGMIVGSKLINPGPHTRGRALVLAGREAGQILYGVIVMLCIAAVIEGWLSPSSIPGEIRIAIGVANMAMLILYFTLVGRRGGAR